jgi:hypothetical protein
MRRLLLLLPLVLLIPAGAGAASATPVCASVRTSGTVIGEHSSGAWCASYPRGVHCQTTGGGLEPSASVETTVCVPQP